MALWLGVASTVLLIPLGLLTNLVSERIPGLPAEWLFGLFGGTSLLVVAIAVWQVIAQTRGTARSAERRARERRQALARVTAAIQSALDRSLGSIPQLTLLTEARPDLVPQPNALPDAPPLHEDGKPKEHKEPIAEIFDSTGQALLLLGPGGSGKSVMLAQLCQHLCQRAAEEDDTVVPVLVNLTSWADEHRSFEQWLIEAIVNTYPGIGPNLARELVQDRALILLLDGLDEIPAVRHRERALREIDSFLTEGPCPVAIACRTEDFQGLKAPGAITYAVEIRRPTREQAKAFLTRLGTPAAYAVRDVSPDDRSWWTMMRSAIMLGLVARVSAADANAELVSEGSPSARRRHIISVYVDTLLRRRAGRRGGFAPEQGRRWLAWLATWMTRHNSTEFYVDRLPAAWIKDIGDIRTIKPKQPSMDAGLIVMAATYLLYLKGEAIEIAAVLISIMAVTLAVTINTGAHHSSTDKPIQLVWRIRWGWAFPALAVVPYIVLGAAAAAGAADSGALRVLAYMLLSTPLAMLAYSIAPTSAPDHAGMPPGARLRWSRRMALRGALWIGLPLAVVLAVPVTLIAKDTRYGLLSAAVMAVVLMAGVWAICGGIPVWQYSRLFREIRRSGRGPRDYLGFLDWAQERLLLEPNGSALRFPHKEIQRHLAESWDGR